MLSYFKWWKGLVLSMKKIFAMTLCLILSVNLLCYADINSDVFEVTSLGIMVGDENGNLNLNSNMTRAEFAKIAVILKGWEEVMAGVSNAPDVPANHWANRYISIVMSTNIMTGNTSGDFRPDDTITLEECVKTIVTALGYEVLALEKGGYPDGYIAAAYEIRIMKGISGGLNFPAVRGDIVKLISNSLDVPHLTSKMYNDSGNYVIDKDTTFRKLLAKANETYQMRGVITANYDVWLIKPLSSIKENEVEINGIIFDQGSTNASDYLGLEVNIYYHYNENNSLNPKITNIELTRGNTVTKIKASDISSFNDEGIEFFEEGRSSDRKISFNGYAKFYYNKRILTSLTYEVANIKNGHVEIIDNNGDDSPDYIFIYDYDDYLVVSVSGERSIKVKRYTGTTGISVNETNIVFDESNNRPYIIKDAVGRHLEPQDIPTDRIISVFTNQLDTTIEIIVSKGEIVTGTVSEKNAGDKTVTVDEIVYKLSNEAMFDGIDMGRLIDFHLNNEEKIAYYREYIGEENAVNFGYILSAESDRALGGDIKVRILTADRVINREEDNNADRTDTNKIPVTLSANKSVDVMTLTKRIGIGRFNIESSRLLTAEYARYLNTPIRYQTNSNGEINKIETLELAGGRLGEKISFNANEKVFGGKININPFAINSETMVICVPTHANPSDDDCLVQLSIDNKDVNLQYEVQGYELDPETKAVKLLVLTNEMYADKVSTVLHKSSKIGLVERVVLAIDEDGEPYSKITMLTKTEKTEYKSVLHHWASQNVLDLAAGDLIYYELNAKDLIDNVMLIKNLKQLNESYYEKEYTVDEQLSGFVEKISFNEIDNVSRIKINILTAIVNERIIQVDIPVRNYPDIFLYTKSTGKAEVGKYDDILLFSPEFQNQDRILLVMPNKAIRALVIIRER